MNTPQLWLFLLAALIAGALLAGLAVYWWHTAKLRAQAHDADIKTALLQQQLGTLHQQFTATQNLTDTQARALDMARGENRTLATKLATQTAHAQRAAELDVAVRTWQDKANALREALHTAQVTAEKLAVQMREERETADEKLALLQQARSELGLQFKELANQILEEKTRTFTEQNQVGLNRLLAPVQERMQEFAKLVQETHTKDRTDRGMLQQELQRLQQLNTQLNSEAQALTLALTGGNNKTQGMWGEMILEKILEHSGLRRDQEFIVQAALTRRDEDGSEQLRPDAVILLPENRHIVIDAKVSLNAYVTYANAEDEAARTAALNAHIASVRRHIKDLSGKRYHDLPQGAGLDFVLMFIPVEPAYLLALQKDESLLADAFDRHIMPVGPSTLLAVLRTIANVWRYEHQNRNALAIAEAGGRLHDKFVTLLNTLERLGSQLDTADKTYHEAMKQLSEGRGNLITRVKNLQEMGAKASKKLPDHALDEELADDTPLLDDRTE